VVVAAAVEVVDSKQEVVVEDSKLGVEVPSLASSWAVGPSSWVAASWEPSSLVAWVASSFLLIIKMNMTDEIYTPSC